MEEIEPNDDEDNDDAADNDDDGDDDDDDDDDAFTFAPSWKPSHNQISLLSKTGSETEEGVYKWQNGSKFMDLSNLWSLVYLWSPGLRWSTSALPPPRPSLEVPEKVQKILKFSSSLISSSWCWWWWWWRIPGCLSLSTPPSPAAPPVLVFAIPRRVAHCLQGEEEEEQEEQEEEKVEVDNDDGHGSSGVSNEVLSFWPKKLIALNCFSF